MPPSLSELNKIFSAKMTDEDFTKLSTFIYREYGIKMPAAKKTMLQSRLQKRLRELQITSYKDYIAYAFRKENVEEIVNMIDVVSTNKTDFFREPSHFEFLKDELLPRLSAVSQRQVKIWSAGCSSGEEPYTIAMVMSEYIAQHPGMDFSILGTDISSRILRKAVSAIYPEDRVNVIPLNLKKRYLLKSKDAAKKQVRIVPALRNRISFSRLNFMDSSYSVPELFDIVFCRNVLIYFDRETQESVINKLCTKLKKGGVFFLGHSESIINLSVPLKQIRPTIYQRI